MGDVTVRPESDLERDIAAKHFQIAVLAVPGDAAQKLVDRIVKAGIKGILSFAPVQLTVPPDASLRAVNMAMELEGLTFALTNK